MDLLEYQAKELFREVGIPVLPSQTIADSRAIKQLQIPYPVVLKSQVRAGGRGKAGGIRFVENTIDAIAAAQMILNLPIAGEYPQLLLAEARYDAEQELYLAVILDYQRKRPVLLGSAQGGVNIDVLLEQMQQVVIEDEFSPFYARRLVYLMGVQGHLIPVITDIVGKMYELFVRRDLNGIEINPLGIRDSGEVMALDGKVTMNDHALARHLDLMAVVGAAIPLATTQEELEDNRADNGDSEEGTEGLDFEAADPLDWYNREGNIGILCNGRGLAALTWDLLTQAGGKPRTGYLVGGEHQGKILKTLPLEQQLNQGLERLSAMEEIEVIFLHLVCGLGGVERVAEAIANVLQAPVNPPQRLIISEDRLERPTANTLRILRQNQLEQTSRPTAPSNPRRSIPLVIRLLGEPPSAIQEALSSLSVHWSQSLDEAIEQTVILAQVAI
ncbi:hypothetical protein K4A83_14560 [Spirulina subsalsa FACHB-351]|uniref:ATP-grasp domain-containing protein n=1 Tax=Spirulina subsalsa FACHB-351 TaxID=234711 RepID=A0ABT3L7J6_9CYAN|nr:ATP-grasp domain-containing protein [Spirulina subsalsa]MCW6037486.1 hypothetical protein [Spirulina subsalsa FACHB-351]